MPQPTQYVINEFLHLAPTTPAADATFKVQVRGADGRHTRWLNLDREGLRDVELALLNCAVRREEE